MSHGSGPAGRRIVIGAIVNNHFGVLTRVSEMFAKRGYNIESLVVGVTDDPDFSRMTIVAIGDDYVREQIVKQLDKLFDVQRASVIPEEMAVVREHMLVKLHAAPENSSGITALLNSYGAKMVDFSTGTITAEVCGDVGGNERFIQAVRSYGIIEICRAGAQALHKGGDCL
jgi:acetolactate synthase-1/3 small subunit